MIAEKVQEKVHDKVTDKAHDKAGERAHDQARERAQEQVSEKVHERVIEKRKALGRGLESLLPRPRAVTAPVAEPAGPQGTRNSNEEAGTGDGRARTPVAPSPATDAQLATAQPTIVQTVYAGPTISQSAFPPPSASQPRDQATVTRPEAGISIAGVPAASTSTERIPLEAESDFYPVAPKPGLNGAPTLESPAPGETLSAPSQAATADAPGAPMSAQATVAELMASAGAEEVMQLPIHLIEQNPHQTRTRFKEEPLKELAESIKVQGVLQPVVVRPGQEGRYQLILGERRMRASVMAGLETIPAIVKRVSEQQAAEMTLVENLQRQDLNCVEQAWAFSRMSQEFKLTQEQIGARVGMSREAVSNYMRLLTLPEGVHEMLIVGKLSYSHARALLKVNTSSQELLWAYAKKALDEKMSVAKLEELVAGLPRAPKAPGQGGARWVDPNVKAAQRRLEEILGMRVRIRDQAGRGKILIEYSTIEDFDRVMEMLGGK